jgi:hypothetical protein
LVRSPILEKLQSFDLNFSRLGPKEARKIAGSPFLANLKSFNLSNTDIGPKGALAIASSETLRNLQYVNFHGVDLGQSEGAQKIVDKIQGSHSRNNPAAQAVLNALKWLYRDIKLPLKCDKLRRRRPRADEPRSHGPRPPNPLGLLLSGLSLLGSVGSVRGFLVKWKGQRESKNLREDQIHQIRISVA